MDYNYLAAPMMYTYSAIDLQALTRNMGAEVSDEDLRLLITAILRGVPGGRENTSGSVALPHSVLITVGSASTTLASAFLRPVDDLDEATEQMAGLLASYRTGLGLDLDYAGLWSVGATGPAGASLDGADSVAAILDRVLELVHERTGK